METSLSGRRELLANATSSVTHLLWIGRWVEVVKTADGWQFKTGRDAAEWLLW